MTVELIGDDRAAPPGSPLRLRNGVACRAGTKWRADGSDFLVPRGMAATRGPHSTCRMGWVPTGEESCGRPLRENDRGAAVLRSDMSNRGRVGRARVQTDNLAMRPSVIGGICHPMVNTPAAVRTLSCSIGGLPTSGRMRCLFASSHRSWATCDLMRRSSGQRFPAMARSAHGMLLTIPLPAPAHAIRANRSGMHTCRPETQPCDAYR